MGRLFADFVCRLNSLAGFFELWSRRDNRPCRVAAPASTPSPILASSDETNSRIYRVFDAHTPAADGRNRMSDLRRINFGNETRTRGFYLKRFRHQRKKAGRVVANSRIATLRRDILTKTLQRLARAHNLSANDLRAASSDSSTWDKHQHVRGQARATDPAPVERQLVAFATQQLNTLFHFE